MVQVFVWAGRDNPKPGGVKRGDIVEFLEDGVDPGPRAGRFSTAAKRELTPAEMRSGLVPDYLVLDVPGLDATQARTRLAQRVASVLELPMLPRRLPWLPKTGRVDMSKLAESAADLRETGRAQITESQLWFAMTAREGLTVDALRVRITDNGRVPSEWTAQE